MNIVEIGNSVISIFFAWYIVLPLMLMGLLFLMILIYFVIDFVVKEFKGDQKK